MGPPGVSPVGPVAEAQLFPFDHVLMRLDPF